MEAFRNELMAKSRKEAEELKLEARRAIDEEYAKATAQVKAMSVDLAIEIAQKLIGERLDDSKHRQLAMQFVDQLPGQGKGPGGARLVRVRSPLVLRGRP